MNKQTTIFGAGCFWGVEVAFRRVDGVLDAEVGYAGGDSNNPTYEQVCGGQTGHAEVVRVTFDADRVGFETLLGTFWGCHDPTQVDRQGWDVGSQYRSIILFEGPEQSRVARAQKDQLDAAATFGAPIATTIEPAGRFWRAEEYHQRYLEKRGSRRFGF